MPQAFGAGSLWHKRAGASITGEALDQRETSLDIPRPIRVDQTGEELWEPAPRGRISLGLCFSVEVQMV